MKLKLFFIQILLCCEAINIKFLMYKNKVTKDLL